MSKATKGIIALIVTLAVFGFFSSAGLILLIAAIGGLFVFLGLWIENEADEETKREHLSNFTDGVRRLKFKNRVGWWILMIGIALEIAIACYEAIKTEVEIRQIKQQASKNDPMNRPVENISARIIFRFAGKIGAGGQSGFDQESWMELLETNTESRTLYLGRFQSLLAYDVQPYEQRDATTNYHCCTVKFVSDPFMTGVESGHVIKDNNPISPSLVLDRIRTLRFHLKFLPDDAEIIDGKAELSVNQEIQMFNIQARQLGNENPLLNTNGTPFFFYATNSIP